jgi:hypothetical protein
MKLLQAPAGNRAVPGRRGLRIALGLLWLLDAALQFQPYMFTPFFVTQQIQLSSDGSPGIVAAPVNWASHLMLAHIAVYNAIFATIQLLIALGIFFPRTLRLALAASIAWSLGVWWFGESLGGIFAGASPLAGFPGGVILYALIAVLLWPRAPSPSPSPSREPASPGYSGLLRPWAAIMAWVVLWGSFGYSLLLPDNRDPAAIGEMFASTDAQPGWIVAVMNGLSRLTAGQGGWISVILAIACAAAAVGVLFRPTIKPALALAVALAAFIWIAEGLGGIFTGQGTDPNTGPLLALLAACYWPRGQAGTAGRTGVPMRATTDPSVRFRYGA